MKTKDYVVIGGLALIAYLLWKRSALGGGAGSHGGSAGGCGCGGAGGSSAINPYTGGVIPGCPSRSPGFGNYTQGTGPMPPEAGTPYVPGDSDAWDSPGFHFALDLSF